MIKPLKSMAKIFTNYRRFLYLRHLVNCSTPLANVQSEETFGSVGFESIFKHLEIISNGRPIKAHNDKIDISKLNSYNEPKFSPAVNMAVFKCMVVLVLGSLPQYFQKINWVKI